jgi:hypothetical protein
MESLLSKSNLATAGVTTLMVMFAMNLTAGKGKLVQGGAAFAAALVGLQLAKKVA